MKNKTFYLLNAKTKLRIEIRICMHNGGSYISWVKFIGGVMVD